MPILDDDTVVPDEEGLMLTSWEAVQRETAKSLADLARDEVFRSSCDGPLAARN
jgi:hypothetical protein